MDNKALKNPGGDFLPFAETAVRTLYSKKASNIRMYRLGEDSVIADCYIICTGRSGTHVRSLADALEEEFEKIGRHPLRTEGKSGSSWLLCDYGDFIVHIFDRESREFYDLDRLMPTDGAIDIKYITDKVKEEISAEKVEK